jgi:hypothetical protein
MFVEDIDGSWFNIAYIQKCFVTDRYSKQYSVMAESTSYVFVIFEAETEEECQQWLNDFMALTNITLLDARRKHDKD